MGRDAVHGRPVQLRTANRKRRRQTLVIAAALLAGLSWVSLRAHDPIPGAVTWTGDIGRLVQARCVGCHVAGGRGPMPLTSYEQARPWAKAIRDEVLARRMPKWHAARGYGQFANDRSLTPFEIALIVAWVDGGAVRDRPAATQGVAAAITGSSPVVNPPASLTTAPTSSRRLKTRRLACGDQPLTGGRLLALTPHLSEGGSAGIMLVLPDGSRQILAWIRGFERKFTETYWLRTPIDLPAGTVLRTEAEGRCRVVVTLDQR